MRSAVAVLILALAGGIGSVPADQVERLSASTVAETTVQQPGEQVSQQAREERTKAYFGDDILIDQDGRQQRFFTDLLRGRTVLINVIFTNCDDACPMMTKRLGVVRQRLGSDFGDSVYFLSLSVDPKRDTPESLKAFAVRNNADEPGWRFLVADEPTMARLLTRLGQWSDEPENHMTLLIAGNASKAHWKKLRPDASPVQIAEQLQRF